MELPSSWKVIVFTINLIAGLIISQIVGATMPKDAYKAWMEVVIGATMWCLSYIMINVGYEFTIDKKALGEYGWDYLIAMTAAGFPWLFVALWFFYTLGNDMPMSQALLVARFAAPTSAGILFSMLDAAGLKDTWVFNKARILAIFDDLDTILLMIPLKVVLVGFKWELTLSIGIMVVLLCLAWFKLHDVRIPYSATWTLFYAGIIAIFCKVLHIVTHYHIDMEAIHLEVLLPAFVLGTLVDTPCARHELELQRRLSTLRKSRTMQSKSGELSTTRVQVQPATLAEVPEGTERADVEHAKEPALRLDVRLDSKGPSKAPQAQKQPLAGLIVHDLDDGVEPISVVPSSQDAGDNKAQLTQAGAPVVAFTAAWPEKERKAARLCPTPPDHRSASKQSKQSALSNGSKASKMSSRSLTRYGHSRQDINLKSPKSAEAKSQATNGEPHVTASPEPEEESPWEEYVSTGISMVFMVLVGLSMPALIGKNAKDNTDGLSAGTIVFHVFLVSVLMVVGKMFPVCCYRDEAPMSQRLGLCLGMCPRGEVGASIIVISLELGVEGPAIIISMCALGGNLIMSGFFIAMVKYLLKGAPPMGLEGGEQVVQTTMN